MQNNRFKLTLFFVTFLTPFFCTMGLSTAILGATSSSDASYQLFVTDDGDRIVGVLTNPDQEPRKEYSLQTPDGKKVIIPADKLKNSRAASDNEVEYVKRRAAAPDTVEGQWELAEWCRENFFLSDRKTHLNRIIELQPDHRDARAALGYSLVDGKWMTQDEIQKSRGYQYYKGRWRTEQQIESLKKTEKRDKEEKLWYAQIKRYTSWLGTSKTELAMQNFSKITDPAAVKALGSFLAGDYPRATKLVFIHTLVHIGKANPEDRSPDVPLALCAIEDPDEETRLSCLDYLKTTKDPDVVDFFVSKLNVTLATRKYKDNANMMINRAAFALGEMGDDSAVGPLIKVLITEHKKKITSGKPGQTSATFGNRGGGGISMGSSTKIVTYPMNNMEVLEALKKLTGVSFNYDVPTWQAWYDQQTKQATPDVRRGN